MDTQNWLLLTYKVPPEPAKKRIALWRPLKGMGGIYLQNGVCLLPKSDDYVRQLKMLENDISEMKGDSVILETVALDRFQEDKVVARFKADRDEEYREFLDKCHDFDGEIAKEIAANHFAYAELQHAICRTRCWGHAKAMAQSHRGWCWIDECAGGFLLRDHHGDPARFPRRSRHPCSRAGDH